MVVNQSLNKALGKIDTVWKQSHSYVSIPEIGYKVYIVFSLMNAVIKVQ